ncbi:hypothetical protein QT381_01590 [Galbitalea sp. SE-J8]|uniref:hypothetical protein n=1 Tax=Galbitalea sp. SE-J8 TaxID=3054952 RepID=UPI00259C88C4|nr:hypothetical protein [Galbitalea sp. SE-J8]MDM4761697.1 hypothetical protein [Galbitalea sp. SE-J8]
MISLGLYGGVGTVLFGTTSSLAWSIASAIIRAAVVLVVVWRIVPLDGSSRLPRVTAAAGLSAVLTAIVEAIVELIPWLVTGLRPDRSFFANSFPVLNGLPDALRSVTSAVVGIPFAALSAFPLIALVLIVVARHRGELRSR